jgi:RND family efflux transporter MFP subunit
MIIKKVWIPLAIVALLAAGIYYRTGILTVVGQMVGTAAGVQAQSADANVANLTTTAIRPASEVAQVSAAGNIALSSQRSVVLQASGIVSQVFVEVSDQVAAGDLLVELDTSDLELAVAKAQLEVDSVQLQLDSLLEPADASEVAAARSGLASARQNLLDVQAGPSEAELAAAEAKLAAAQAAYQELEDGPSEAELTQLSADMQKAMITLQDAQWAYDQVSYRGDVGASSQAAALQEATITYEAAKAAYEIATQPATQSDLQSALSTIRSAQNELDTLRSQPTEAELAAAQASVDSAQSQLDALLKGASQADIRSAEISVQQARLSLQDAQVQLQRAQLRAPVAGTVLAVDVEVGQQISSGTGAVTLADLSALELTVNVAEVDVNKVKPNQAAKITVDALPGQVLQGTVARVAPASEATSGVVNYPLTIRLTDPDLSGVRAGMTAVADLVSDDLADAWLVPTAAVAERDGQSIVMIVRNGQPMPIPVVTQGIQGEWTIVRSAELRDGDQAIGAVTSKVNETSTGGRFGPGSGMGMPLGGPPPGQ